jgi:hypothetical protein
VNDPQALEVVTWMVPVVKVDPKLKVIEVDP